MPFRVYAILMLWVFGPLPTQACPNEAASAPRGGCVELVEPEKPQALRPATREVDRSGKTCADDAFCLRDAGGDAPTKTVRVQKVAPDSRTLRQ